MQVFQGSFVSLSACAAAGARINCMIQNWLTMGVLINEQIAGKYIFPGAVQECNFTSSVGAGAH